MPKDLDTYTSFEIENISSRVKISPNFLVALKSNLQLSYITWCTYSNIHLQQGVSTLVPLTFEASLTFIVGCHSVNCWKFSSISGVCPQVIFHVNQTCLVTTANIPL